MKSKSKKSGKRLGLEVLRINSEVQVSEMKDDIGIGVINGAYLYKESTLMPIVRFYLDEVTEKGRQYLNNLPCLTVNGKRSRLYLIDPKELEFAESKRKVLLPCILPIKMVNYFIKCILNTQVLNFQIRICQVFLKLIGNPFLLHYDQRM